MYVNERNREREREERRERGRERGKERGGRDVLHVNSCIELHNHSCSALTKYGKTIMLN